MIKCGITGSSGVLGQKLIKKANFKFVKFRGNISNKNDVNTWIQKNQFDLIIHLAAIVPTNIVNRNYKIAKKVNYLGTVNLIKSINKYNSNLKWFFFASTSHVYSINKNLKLLKENSTKKPYTLYGQTKLYAENFIKKNLKKRYKCCIGRIFSFTDKKQAKYFFIPSMVNKILTTKNKTVFFKNLSHYRDFISTDDICSAITHLWKKKAVGEYNIASGKKIYLEDLVKLICKKKKKIPFIVKENHEKTYLLANINKIKKTGWKPSKNINNIVADYLS
jgi:UDP-glucose 4-epimerase